MKKKIVLCIAALVGFGMQAAFAQAIHYTQIGATPLAENPAYTGMFSGDIRASVLYSNQWSATTVPYITYAASVDMPLYTSANGDYIAAGAQLLKDAVGDGDLANFNGVVSLAYHKLFVKNKDHYSDLALGLSGGYVQDNFNISEQYFKNTGNSSYPYMPPAFGAPVINTVSYYPVNAGISFAHAAGARFNYNIGIAAYNFNQPGYTVSEQQQHLETEKYYLETFKAEWLVSGRLSLRPQLLVQSGYEHANYLIAGNELNYLLDKRGGKAATSVFIGGWWHTGNVYTATAGAELKGFRIGVGYDHAIQEQLSERRGGLEISARYIARQSATAKRIVPCGNL